MQWTTNDALQFTQQSLHSDHTNTTHTTMDCHWCIALQHTDTNTTHTNYKYNRLWVIDVFHTDSDTDKYYYFSTHTNYNRQRLMHFIPIQIGFFTFSFTFCWQSCNVSDFANVNVEPRTCVCVCVCVCVCGVACSSKRFLGICWSSLSNLAQWLPHVLIIYKLTFTFIQGHTDLNHENTKCLIISNYSSNAHQVCCEDSPTKGLYDHCQSDDLDWRCVSNLTTF